MSKYDVIVVGAGPAGTALCYELSLNVGLKSISG